MPIGVERADMQRPHADVYDRGGNTLTRTPSGNIYESTRHLPSASILTLPMKFSRFQNVKKERQVNAKNMSQPARTTHAGSLRAVCRRKISKKISKRTNIICSYLRF